MFNPFFAYVEWSNSLGGKKELFQNCNVGARAYTLDQLDLSTPIGQPNIFLDREFYEEGQEPII